MTNDDKMQRQTRRAQRVLAAILIVCVAVFFFLITSCNKHLYVRADQAEVVDSGFVQFKALHPWQRLDKQPVSQGSIHYSISKKKP